MLDAIGMGMMIGIGIIIDLIIACIAVYALGKLVIWYETKRGGYGH